MAPGDQSLSEDEMRRTWALVDILTSLKRRGTHPPPTAELIRRKLDALSSPALDTLSILMDSTIAEQRLQLSPPQVRGMVQAVRVFPEDTASEVGHVHACGTVVSEEVVGLVRERASHVLRIGLEHLAAARRKGVPLRPIATNLHANAMTELKKGGQGSALGVLNVSDATMQDGLFVSAAGLLVGTAFCTAVMDQLDGASLGPICCGSCLKVAGADELFTCRRCGDHLFCETCLASDGPERHARECGHVRTWARTMTDLMLPRMRKSVRCVAVVQLSDRGVIAPMHITSISSPLVPSSLLNSLSRGLAIDEIVVYWRLLVAFLAKPEGDEQELLEREGTVYRVDPAALAIADDDAARRATTRKARAPLSSEKRRLQKEKKKAERKARDDACVAAEASAVAEADAELERQLARPDATSAMLTSVLLKRGGTASPEVVTRTRVKRDSLKVTERRARKPAKVKLKESNAAERMRIGEDLTARLSAVLLLQRRARTWIRCRKKLLRKRRSLAAKLIQRAARTWLLRGVTAASSSGNGDDGEEVELPEPDLPRTDLIDPATTECTICLDDDAEYAVVPCGHRCLCFNCSKAVSECPVCRGAMTAVLRVFV